MGLRHTSSVIVKESCRKEKLERAAWYLEDDSQEISKQEATSRMKAKLMIKLSQQESVNG